MLILILSVIIIIGDDIMSKIIDIKSREILDSRGNPTVEVHIVL